MWRPRLPSNPDFLPVAIAVVALPALGFILEGEPVLPTLLTAAAAIFLWHAATNWRR